MAALIVLHCASKLYAVPVAAAVSCRSGADGAFAGPQPGPILDVAFYTLGILMTADSFRKLALTLPGAEEGAHMNHPDFRVGGRIFATLGYPRAGWAAVAVTPDDQAALVAINPNAFVPVKGKWGEQGATNVILRHAKVGQVSDALDAAYETRQARSRKHR